MLGVHQRYSYSSHTHLDISHSHTHPTSLSHTHISHTYPPPAHQCFIYLLPPSPTHDNTHQPRPLHSDLTTTNTFKTTQPITSHAPSRLHPPEESIDVPLSLDECLLEVVALTSHLLTPLMQLVHLATDGLPSVVRACAPPKTRH